MTRDETKTILATMASVYSTNLMPPVTELTVNVWYQLLQDIPYKLASSAVASWLTTSKYPPSLADIRELCVQQAAEPRETAEQAWGRLLTAVRKYGHTMPTEAEKYLGDIWPIVNQFTWRYFCEMPVEKESTYCAQFRNAYNAEMKRAAERLQIPASIRQALTSGQLRLESAND